MSWSQPAADDAATCEPSRQVTIDRSKFTDRARYTCPNGHIDWDRTNSHIWCRGCRRLVDNGHDDIDPEHYAIYDKQEDVTVAWGQVRLTE